MIDQSSAALDAIPPTAANPPAGDRGAAPITPEFLRGYEAATVAILEDIARAASEKYVRLYNEMKREGRIE
jgi:hypothetical protein